MFHVFWVLPPGVSRNFSKSQCLENFLNSRGLSIGRKLYTTTRTLLRSVLRSPKSQSLFRVRGVKLEIFLERYIWWLPSPFALLGSGAYTGEGKARNFAKSQRLYRGPESTWGESLQFSQVPGPLCWRERYIRWLAPCFALLIPWETYLLIFSTYFFIFWHVSCLCGDLTLMTVFPPTFIFKFTSPPPPLLNSYLEKFREFLGLYRDLEELLYSPL